MDATLDTPEQRRHQYGLIISLTQFRDAYHNNTGLCRGCGTPHAGTPLDAKGQTCAACGRPRVFGAVWYAWNGWIDKLPARSWRGINIKRLLTEDN